MLIKLFMCLFLYNPFQTIAMAMTLVAPGRVAVHRQVSRTRSAPPSANRAKEEEEGENPRKVSKTKSCDPRLRETKMEFPEKDR